MLSFLSDYTEGAHPKVLEHLIERNMVTLPGYGNDDDTAAAKARICRACGRDDLQIQFLTGGTQTNQVAIASMLKPYQGVVAAQSGHVAVHEAGAIEHSGHKVITLPSVNGKISPRDLREYMKRFYADESYDHMVYPGMVYITHPSEYGTLYTKAELREISEICHEYEMTLYLDGARLGYGLVSPENELTMQDICEYTDLFYIGGTKVGALCGEALIFTKQNMPYAFTAIIKQKGALLAKMRIVSQQFDALFTDNLYFEIARSAIGYAMQIKKAFTEHGYELYIDSPTNQQFFIMPNSDIEALRGKGAAFEIWERIDDDKSAVRFVTSWSTTQAQIDGLIALL